MNARFKSDRAMKQARSLRKNMTRAEKQLWSVLRKHELHFRKQVAIGPFIADFACHSAKLIIEVDGGAHRAPDVALRDQERQVWLEGRGYCVLRFANSEIEDNVAHIADEIIAEASARRRLLSAPFPLAGEGRVGGVSAIIAESRDPPPPPAPPRKGAGRRSR